MRRIKHIHFIGIGGAGMGGIAEVLHNQGYLITGSDLSQNAMTQRLSGLGIRIIENHHADNIKGADVVVITSALAKDNPEWLAARSIGIPVVRRAEMLAELMRFGQGIAIAGCHGKTTTTSILASIMATANLDPTFVIGGKLNSLGANAKLGTGKYFIAEADESDASFLHLNPVIAIVTNIARDHMGTYGGDFKNLRQAFVDFLHRLPFYGMAVLNIDDPVVRDLIPELHCQVVTYGCSANADYRLIEYKQENGHGFFEIVSKFHHTTFKMDLNLPGLHNAQNALAAMAVCLEESIEPTYIQKALATFSGTGRRFQVYEKIKLNNKTEVTLIDDYGHHPDEIGVMLNAIKFGWPERRLVMLFQPHRYTRTRDLFDEFVNVLSQAPVLILLPVYAASEQPLPGASSAALHQAVLSKHSADDSLTHKAHCFDSMDALLADLGTIIQDNDVLVVQGAGDISEVVDQLLNIHSGKNK